MWDKDLISAILSLLSIGISATSIALSVSIRRSRKKAGSDHAKRMNKKEGGEP